ncbi:MAG: indolepyruvate ferredoxin oxidoreductase subunit alpha [Desulfobacterota bacterium]|nr:indolepyruvate ferredoxin oxidoreductase subunit alpha [Thermodesulfobacteriota bacterium]
MSNLLDTNEGAHYLYMGNDAIVRGALEGGVSVAAGYPGTPSSEIIEQLARISDRRSLYVEWATNEKIATEIAAAASFAGLRSICTMKQNGVHVASDFLLHLTGTGVRGGMVVVVCEDPGALSSQNEADARYFAKMLEVPLLEPGDFQEAKDMMKWALELSEELKTFVIFRSVTRMSHASGNVVIGELPENEPRAYFQYKGPLLDFLTGPMVTGPGVVAYARTVQQGRLKRAVSLFEQSRFNIYAGPERPELLIITSSACYLYSKEAIHTLNLGDRVGLLKLGTTWPLPEGLVRKHLAAAQKVLVVEEPQDFMEENIKILAADAAGEVGVKTFYGKKSGHVPTSGELNPDIIMNTLKGILGIQYEPVPQEYATKAFQSMFKSPGRELTFCPGCPHRASFLSLHNALALDNRDGFVCGDVGCYGIGVLPAGFSTVKTNFSMGSGLGLATGFGKLTKFGMNQPVVAVCGDSTFFHAVMPALVDAVHHQSDVTLVVLDNSGTAMTGFQPHPGLAVDAMGETAPSIDIEAVCRAIGADVASSDPFDVERTEKTLLGMLKKKGAKVVILRQICALSPEKRGKKKYQMSVREDVCIGENCGCNRMCTRILRCPGIYWDTARKVSRIDEVICAGCGVCASVCPSGAIQKAEVA